MKKSEKQKALARVLNQRKKNLGGNHLVGGVTSEIYIPEAFYRFDQFVEYLVIRTHKVVADTVDVATPFFLIHDGCAHDVTHIDGRELINFGTYNYLDLNGHPRVNAAAIAAIETYGTSASASRLIAGERPPHAALEKTLAEFYGVEEAITFVSGHATNVSTIGTLFGPQDLILHDRLVHNSILQGIQLSGAKRQPFAHNNWQELENLLARSRHHFEKTLICVEGLYSMDGDIPPLDRIVEVAKKHKALLMVDEAHSLGSVGKTGRGIGEHFGLNGSDVDIWMGTLSKTLAGCGGYIAGSRPLIEILKYAASSFVYSVGMPPAMAASAREALFLMQAEPERTAKLRRNGSLFVALAKARGLDTGLSDGYNVVPVITGGSVQAVKVSHLLMEKGVYVSPVIHPAVEEKAARLRFFISSAHSEEQISFAVDATAQAIKEVALSEI
jgi:8-amino-7-oxononanoate synthase